MGKHFVPQEYLRHFEIPGKPDFIWLHDKRGGLARVAAIDKVAQVKNFYNEETEAILARDVEVPGNKVIRTLMSNGTITLVERLQLAYYIGVMMKRIPARRRHAMEMIPSVLADVTTRVRRELEAIANELRTDPELLAHRLREVDAFEKNAVLQPPAKVLDLIREPWPSEGMLRALFGMTWRILVTSGPQFFATTDNPVFFFRAFGLATKRAEITFPLSTKHALHGSWQKANSDLVYLDVSQRTVKEINRRVASEAERLAFYHEPAQWLLEILPKKKPYLSVIQWQRATK
jgi:hypothetical protein